MLLILEKILVHILSDMTQNEFMVQDSFTIVDEFLTQDSDLYMAGLDVDALFTNIPLKEIIHICVKKTFSIQIFWSNEYLKMIFMIY